MIPIRDTLPSRHIPWMSRALIFLNIVLFIVEIRQGANREVFLYRFGLVPSHWLISGPGDLLDWPPLFLTLLTSQFLHGGIFHLASNMLYLWIFADNVEDFLRPIRFLLLYLGSGVLAGIVQMFASPGSSIPMVGASGAIAGVLGAYLMLFPSARVVTLVPMGIVWETIHVPAFVFLGIWFLLQWWGGFTAIGQVADVGGVAFWAHIGGFVNGIVAGLWLRSKPRW